MFQVPLKQRQPAVMSGILGFALVAGAFVLLSLLPVLDYHYYSDAANAWRHGLSRLYDTAAPGFYYFPWALVLTLPLSFLPDRWGQAAFNLISLASLVWAVRTLSIGLPWRALVLSLSTPFTAAILCLGQWDGLIVAGVALGWRAVERHRSWLLGLALAIIATKPTNAFLPAAFLLWSVRHWQPLAIMKVMAPMGLAVGGSFLACGADWPFRYAAYLRSSPPMGFDVSLWQLELGIPWLVVMIVLTVAATIFLVRNNGVTGEKLSCTLVTNLIISIYAVPYHYVSTAPALAALARLNWRVAVMVWAVSVSLFLAFLMRWPGLPLVAYPLILLTSLVAVHDSGQTP